MRLVRLSTAYPLYLEQFYARRPGLEGEPCADQEKALFYDAFGWADFWQAPMAALGYDVHDVIANAEPMQRAWARENGRRQPAGAWLGSLAADRVRALEPDILFINDYVSFSRPWIEEVRAGCPSIKLVLGWCGAPFPDADVFRGYDAVLSCVPELVEKFQEMGHRSWHLNHAFDRRILERIGEPDRDPFEFTFVGQVHRQSGFHRERERLLLRLLEQTPLTIYSMNAGVGPGRYLMALARKGVYGAYCAFSGLGLPEGMLSRIPVLSRGPRYHDHPFLPVHPGLKKHLKPPVFGLDMFRVLRDSKVTFNSHLNISVHSSSNMRMFEATGAGACLLTDHLERTSRLFEPDFEVVTYRSAAECAEKALYLLDHPARREEIALAAQRRTLRDHSYQVRAGDLDNIIRKELG